MEGHAGAGQLSAMTKQIGLGQLRSNACDYFEKVVAGQTIEVIRRGRLVARIVPIDGGPTEPPILRSADAGMCRLDGLRAHAGRLFDRVAAEKSIEVVWRGLLVARIVSAADGLREAAVPPSVDPRMCELDDLRTRAGCYSDRVAVGETINVVRRGKLVAKIVSATGESRQSA